MSCFDKFLWFSWIYGQLVHPIHMRPDPPWVWYTQYICDPPAVLVHPIHMLPTIDNWYTQYICDHPRWIGTPNTYATIGIGCTNHTTKQNNIPISFFILGFLYFFIPLNIWKNTQKACQEDAVKNLGQSWYHNSIVFLRFSPENLSESTLLPFLSSWPDSSLVHEYEWEILVSH
jgi:hypothetical protein